MNRYARLGSAAGTTSRQRSSPSDTHLSRENKKESFDNGNIHSGIQHSNFNIGSSKDDEGRDSRLHSHCMSGNDEDFVAPLIVHANYCGTKKTCMRERGLWLLESYTVGVGTTSTGEANLVSKSYCKAYNKADTKYGRPHWAYQLDSSELKFRKMLETMNVSNVVKFGRQAEVFIVDNPESSPPGFNPLNKGLKVLRGIPNIATLDRLLWPEIRDISSSLSNVMFVGREIMDLTNVTLPSIAQDNITFEEIFASYKRFERSTDLRTVSKALPGSVNMTEMDSVNLYRAEPQNETSYLPVGQQYWERKASQFAAAEIEVNRTYKIELNIKRTAGIYHDKEKSMSYGLENTILLYVLAYDDIMNLETLHDKNTIEKMTVSDDREIKLASAFGRKLRRFLLSMERYGLNPLLYVSPSVHYGHVDSASASHNIHRVFAALLTTKANTSNDKERNSTERVPHFEIAYSYPIPLCFSFFRPLTEWVDTLDNQHHCSFTGEVPTDIYFGVMTTFIPALEILITGHDVIFIDLGVTMLQDPIPHLAANYDYDRTGENGIPDFSFIKEPIGKRDYCLISEFNFDTQATSTTQNNTSSKSVIDVGVLTKKSGKHVSERVQPNLSLVRLKSSNISISIMRKWINEIVRRHDRNGRAALDFEQLGMTETFNCNGQLQRPYTSHASFRMGGKESKEFREGGRYCYYNGLSFQAYEVMNHCHKKNNFTEHSANSQFFDTDTYISTASAYELKKYTESTRRTVTAEERLKGYGYEMVAVMAHQGPSTASYYDIESKADYYGK